MAVTQQDLEEVHKLTSRLHELVDLGEERLGKMQEFGEDIPHLKALSTRLDEIEAKAHRPGLFAGGTGEGGAEMERKQRDQTRFKALRKLIASGFDMRALPREDREHLVPDQLKSGEYNAKGLDLKALSLTDDTLGGFFVLPEIIQDEIIRNVVLI